MSKTTHQEVYEWDDLKNNNSYEIVKKKLEFNST